MNHQLATAGVRGMRTTYEVQVLIAGIWFVEIEFDSKQNAATFSKKKSKPRRETRIVERIHSWRVVK